MDPISFNRDAKKRPSVLFLCNHNSARSQMAEAILRDLAGDCFEVLSAGIGTKAIKPAVFSVMEEAGISMEGHHSKSLDHIRECAPFDHVIIVCKTDESQCPGFIASAHNKLRWQVESPFPGIPPSQLSEEEKLIHYRSLRDQLRSSIEAWIAGVNHSLSS